MSDLDYKPFYVDHITEINDHYYIFNGYPLYMHYNEDMYHEIHIESKYPITHVKYYEDGCVIIDLISPDTLEIYYGSEFFSESVSDGEISYNNYSFVSLEKASKAEWKPKYLDLKIEFDALFKTKISDYLRTRDKVVINYQTFYTQLSEIEKVFRLDNPETLKTGVLRRLYYLLDKSHYLVYDELYYINCEQRYFHELLRQNKKQFETKDWKDDYLDLESVFNYLLRVDLTDYQLLKNHVIDIYTKTFDFTVKDFRYNHRDVDEQKYRNFFVSLIEQLNLTESQFS